MNNSRPRSAKSSSFSNKVFKSLKEELPSKFDHKQQFNNLSTKAYLKKAFEFAKIQPKTYHDKQTLYSQTLMLKESLHRTLDENNRLKTKITLLEKDKEKIIKAFEFNKTSSKNMTGVDFSSYEQLKKLCRDLKAEIYSTRMENVRLRKSFKYTKLKQIEIQNIVMKEEIERLRKFIVQPQSDTDANYIDKNYKKMLERQLERLKKENTVISNDNKRLKSMVTERENQTQHFEFKNSEGFQQQRRSSILTNNKVKQLEQELEELKREILECPQRFFHNSSSIKGLRFKKNNTTKSPLLEKIKRLPIKSEPKIKFVSKPTTNTYKRENIIAQNINQEAELKNKLGNHDHKKVPSQKLLKFPIEEEKYGENSIKYEKDCQDQSNTIKSKSQQELREANQHQTHQESTEYKYPAESEPRNQQDKYEQYYKEDEYLDGNEDYKSSFSMQGDKQLNSPSIIIDNQSNIQI